MLYPYFIKIQEFVEQRDAGFLDHPESSGEVLR
jgi:hypothetical protein